MKSRVAPLSVFKALDNLTATSTALLTQYVVNRTRAGAAKVAGPLRDPGHGLGRFRVENLDVGAARVIVDRHVRFLPAAAGRTAREVAVDANSELLGSPKSASSGMSPPVLLATGRA